MQLFIQTPGTYVHVKDEMFEIRIRKEGEVKKHAYAAQKITSILMQTGAALSTDAIQLALRHNVDIVMVDYDGQPLGRFWHARLGSTTRIRKRQLEASLDAEGLAAVQGWLDGKLQNQHEFLLDLARHREGLAGRLGELAGRIGEFRGKIAGARGERIDAVADSFRGWEGSAGRAYFEGLSLAIPDKYRFAGRSMRPAKDAFNAALNYAYGVMYSRVEKALMIAGLDPYVGFMHRDDYNTKSLVFDFIEPYRIHAERVVFRLFSGKYARDSHFEALAGGMRLNAEGKPVLVEKLFEYLEGDKIRYRGRNINRMHAMQYDAHAFAQGLLGKDAGTVSLPDSLVL